MKKIFGGFAVYIWLAAALLPLMLLRDFTPDNELRYLSIADEALRDGRWLAFTNHGVAYADKPPLYLWIVMAGKLIFGRHLMWFLSLFSLIPAFVIAEVMGRWARPQLGEDFNTEAKVLLFSCGLFAGMMVVLRMDMLMTMWIVLALYTFYRLYDDRENRYGRPDDMVALKWLFPVWIFLGIFTKGPMAILIPLASIFVFLLERRRLRYFPLVWGWRTWVVLIPLCGLWFYGVYLEGGREYLDNLLFHQTVDRAVDAFHHKRPFHYYFVAMWYAFQPWAFLIIGCAVAAAIRKVRFNSDIERFFLLSGISTIVLLSFISSKIAVYMLPAYPFLVYFAAICANRYSSRPVTCAAVTLPAVVLAVAGVSLAFISGMEGMDMLRHPLVYAAGGILALCCVAGVIFMWRGRDVGYGIRWISLGLFLTVFTASFALPEYNASIGYGRMCDTARSLHDSTGARGYCVYDVSRPDNMDVYLGERPRKITGEARAVADSLATGKWILMTSTEKADSIVGKRAKGRFGEYVVMEIEGRKEDKGK